MSTLIPIESPGLPQKDAAPIEGPVTWARLLQCAGLEVCAPPESATITITAVTDDSRRVQHGSCFVAVHGAGHDGHEYVHQAIDAGASVVVVSRHVDVPAKVLCVRLQETRSALAKLSAAFYGLRGDRSGGLRLIGVTGTNGKTTVTWLLRSIFRAAGHKPAMLGTVEYDLWSDRLAAPLTTPGAVDLARHLASARDRGADTCILEVSSHALDQRRTDGILFSAGVFTNLTGDHLDYHGTMDGYLQAKRRLFESLDAQSVAVINRDDPSGAPMAAGITAPVISYGLAREGADVSGRIEASTSRGCMVALRGRTFETMVRSRMVGQHNVYNLLAAAATAEALGVDQVSIREGLETLDLVPGRLQRIENPSVPFSVFVDYAHSDDALRNVLRALRPVTAGRLICVFGCGGDRDRSKRPRMGAAVGELADRAIVTSDNPRSEKPTAIVEEILKGFGPSSCCTPEVEVDRRSAIERAISTAERRDIVLIAGKGHENYQLIGDQVLDFDDAEIARGCLEHLQCQSITGGAA